MQALEKQLGTQLLERDRRNVTLTPAGRQLLDDAVPLLAAADATRRRVQRAGRGTKRLVVGFRAGLVPTAAIRRFSAAHPEVQVDAVHLEWDEQEDAILGGRVDVAFVRQPIDERRLRLTPLYEEGRSAVLPADHPLAGREELLLADLSDEEQIRLLAPTSTGVILRSIEEKLEYVAAGHGIIVVPQSATQYYTRPDLVYVPVRDAEPDTVMLATDPSRRTRLLSAFVAAAQAEVHISSPPPSAVTTVPVA